MLRAGAGRLERARRRQRLGAGRGRPARHRSARPRRARDRQRALSPLLPAGCGLVWLGALGGELDRRPGRQLAGTGRAQRLASRDRRAARAARMEGAAGATGAARRPDRRRAVGHLAEESHVDVFARGADRALYQNWWTGATGWSAWARIDGRPLDSSPAPVSDTPTLSSCSPAPGRRSSSRSGTRRAAGRPGSTGDRSLRRHRRRHPAAAARRPRHSSPECAAPRPAGDSGSA